jgi:hypothetical protein
VFRLAEYRPGRVEKPIGGLDALHRGEGRGFGLRGVMGGQTLALLGVEHGIALQKGDFPLGLLAFRVRLGLGDTTGE